MGPKGGSVKDLDRRLAELGRTEIDHDLYAMESAVWAKVATRASKLRPMPNRVATAICAATALLATLAGGATAAASGRATPEPMAFAIQ
ncbi:MAG: hypothetical protein DCF16_13585, partial [Alphaproteobacteria bacterium]